MQVEAESCIGVCVEGPPYSCSHVARPFGGLQGGQEALLVVGVFSRLHDGEEPLGRHDIDVKPVGHRLVHREVDVPGLGFVVELVLTETRA